MINFPVSPVLNQIYTFGTKSWIWSGTRWITVVLASTDRIPEGSNVYFTNARVVSALTGSEAIVIEANGRISANLIITGVPSAAGLSSTIQTSVIDLGSF